MYIFLLDVEGVYTTLKELRCNSQSRIRTAISGWHCISRTIISVCNLFSPDSVGTARLESAGVVSSMHLLVSCVTAPTLPTCIYYSVQWGGPEFPTETFITTLFIYRTRYYLRSTFLVYLVSQKSENFVMISFLVNVEL